MQLPPDVVAERAYEVVQMYQQRGGEQVLVVPEMNSIGLALVNQLERYEEVNIYRREEFDKSTKKRMKKLGWRTTRQSKPLLIGHFKELMRKRNPRVCTLETVEEFKTFIYTGNSKKSGMGAKEGFHDDRVIATLLAFFKPGEVESNGKHIFLPKNSENGRININGIEIVPTLIIKNGKARIKELTPIRDVKKWTTH